MIVIGGVEAVRVIVVASGGRSLLQKSPTKETASANECEWLPRSH